MGQIGFAMYLSLISIMATMAARRVVLSPIECEVFQNANAYGLATPARP